MASTPLDDLRLSEALALAEVAVGLTEPNPRVGCVLGFGDGRVIGRGHTQQAGGPHAEVMALRDAAAAGADTAGATAWVTLEPCAHHGRTPPCCDALIRAGVARVVVAHEDPYPQVDGAGIARLRANGIVVELAQGRLRQLARELNVGFFSRVERGRPWVRLKAAISLDGRSALEDGRSQWITGSDARVDGHAWRRRAGAVLTGSGTVLDDDPRLDVRLVETATQPLRIVLDRRLRTPPTARIVAPPGRVLLVASERSADPDRLAAHRQAGTEVLLTPGDGWTLPALLGYLAQDQQVNELHVEAGAELAGAFLDARLVDELLVYQAPMLVGPGRPLARLPPLPALDQASRWSLVDAARMGPDWRLRLRPGVSLAPGDSVGFFDTLTPPQ